MYKLFRCLFRGVAACSFLKQAVAAIPASASDLFWYVERIKLLEMQAAVSTVDYCFTKCGLSDTDALPLNTFLAFFSANPQLLRWITLTDLAPSASTPARF